MNPPITGSISGIIGAGGNVGAAVFSTCFRQMPAKLAFTAMGIVIVVSSVLSLVIFIPGHAGLVFRTTPTDEEMGANDKQVDGKNNNKQDDNDDELEVKTDSSFADQSPSVSLNSSSTTSSEVMDIEECPSEETDR